MKSAWLYAAIAGALVLAAGATARSCRFESAARAAEAYVVFERDSIARAERAADSLFHHAVRVDTVRVERERRIEVVDSISRPDSTCAPAIAIRDSVIDAAGDEIDAWRGAYWNQLVATQKLTAERDTLAWALKQRPSVAGPVLELFHPSLHVAAVLIVVPEVRYGLGLSYDLVRIRL